MNELSHRVNVDSDEKIFLMYSITRFSARTKLNVVEAAFYPPYLR